MYVRERISNLPPGRFIEIGPGSGEISRLLLELGWRGESYDLNAHVVTALERRFSEFVRDGRYVPHHKDYLTQSITEKADLIISCMVIEHLDPDQESQFVRKSLDLLTTDGRIACIVPASPAHWGIEDDIAGHFRRYTRQSVGELFYKNSGTVQHISGLTYPLSNLLLPVSNYLVRSSESWKLSLPPDDQTKLSGRRDVPMKTTFPAVANLLLNTTVLWPLHILQKALSRSERALVIYFEAVPKFQGESNDSR